MNCLYVRSALLAGVFLCLTACATTSEPAAVSDAKPTNAAAPKDDLPLVTMDPQILYDLLVGEIAIQRGQTGIAGQVIGRTAIKTRDPRLAERATLAAYHARRFEDAKQSAELWVELRPDDVDAREALAAVLLELGQPAPAQLQLERIVQLEAVNGQLDQAYLRVVTILSRQSDRTTAMDIMRPLVALHPNSAAAHLYAGHLAMRVNDLDLAASETDMALKLQPDWDEAAAFRGRMLVSQKNFPQAIEYYESFLRRNPKATTVRSSYARFLVDQKRWDKAYVQFKRLAADAPHDADVVHSTGLLALQTNQNKEAERYLRQALELRPDDDQARLYLGQIAEQDKRYDDAARWYNEIDADGSVEAQIRLAMMWARQGKIDEAREKVVAIQATTDPHRVQRALAEEQILRDAKRHREAFDSLNKALNSVPNDKELLYARALSAEKIGMLSVAEADLRAILKQDPKNANALNALGYTLADRTTRYQEAQDYLQQAIALKPDDAFILDSYGWLQYRMGNHAESIKYLKRALEIKNEAEIAAHLGEVLWMAGEQREAESVWSAALRATPDNETLLDVIKKFKP